MKGRIELFFLSFSLFLLFCFVFVLFLLLLLKSSFSSPQWVVFASKYGRLMEDRWLAFLSVCLWKPATI